MVGLGLIGTSLIHAECERDTVLLDVRISQAKTMHLQLLTLVVSSIAEVTDLKVHIFEV